MENRTFSSLVSLVVFVFISFSCCQSIIFLFRLKMLASHFEWFQDAFDKMTKDGRETQWRQITEHEKPEMVALPDGLDEKYVGHL